MSSNKSLSLFALLSLVLFIAAARADNNLSSLLLENRKAGELVKFTLKEDGWIHLKVGEGAAAGLAILDGEGRERSIAIADGEGFAELKKGSYSIRGNYGGGLRIRTVPVTMFCSLAGVDFKAPAWEMVRVPDDSSLSGRPGMFLYNWKWLRSKVLSPFNTVVGDATVPEVAAWRAEGRSCIAGTTSHVEDSAALYSLWKDAAKNGPDGIIADEFVVPVINHANDVVNDTDVKLGYVSRGVGFLDSTYDNIRRFGSDFPGARFHAWLGVPWDADTADSKPLLDTVIESGGVIAWEFYATSNGRNKYPMGRHDVRTAGFLKARPDFMRHAMLCPGIYEFLDTDPSCDFKVWLDEQMYMFANDPRFKGLHGIGMWIAYYADPELLRWYSAMVRHYCIEGEQTKFSDRLGFRLEPGIVRNADFSGGLEHWSCQPAAEGSLSVRKSGELGFDRGYQPFCDQVLSMRHVPGKVNSVSQKLSNLVPGRRYAIKTQVTSPGVTEATRFAFDISVSNGNMEQPNVRNMIDFLPNRNTQFFNACKILFVYNGGDCVLTISDKGSKGQTQADELLVLPLVDPAVPPVLLPHEEAQVHFHRLPLLVPEILPQVRDVLPVLPEQPAGAQDVPDLVRR